jgi:hypothetical protein
LLFIGVSPKKKPLIIEQEERRLGNTAQAIPFE